MRRVLLWGAIGGLLLALLRGIESRWLLRSDPAELYGGLIAALFAGVGLWIGRRLERRREVVELREVAAIAPPPRPPGAPFVADPGALAATGLTRREHEILGLLAEGLSNREIGDRLFISENTVKTHAARVFGKLGVGRRVQAVRRGRELGLVP